MCVFVLPFFPIPSLDTLYNTRTTTTADRCLGCFQWKCEVYARLLSPYHWVKWLCQLSNRFGLIRFICYDWQVNRFNLFFLSSETGKCFVLSVRWVSINKILNSRLMMVSDEPQTLISIIFFLLVMCNVKLMIKCLLENSSELIFCPL